MTKINYIEKTNSQTNLATLILVPLLFYPTSNIPLPSTNHNIYSYSNNSFLLETHSYLDNDYYKSKESLETSKDTHQFLVLQDFVTKLVSNMKDLEPEFAQTIDENFWEMYEPI